MAIVARVRGIRIEFYMDEHPPPHFHAVGGPGRVQIEIATLSVMRGHMEPDKLRSVLSWASLHRPALMAAWEACRRHEDPGVIG
jgi:hypothetical protein